MEAGSKTGFSRNWKFCVLPLRKYIRQFVNAEHLMTWISPQPVFCRGRRSSQRPEEGVVLSIH